MGLPQGYKEFYNQEARLIILNALAEQHDYTLPENLLVMTLQAFGINKGRDYLRNQLTYLKDEAGAVTIRELSRAMIPSLTETGLDHVERRVVLAGIKRPSPPKG